MTALETLDAAWNSSYFAGNDGACRALALLRDPIAKLQEHYQNDPPMEEWPGTWIVHQPKPTGSNEPNHVGERA